MTNENEVYRIVSSWSDVSVKSLCSEPFSALTVDWTGGGWTNGSDSAGASWPLSTWPHETTSNLLQSYDKMEQLAKQMEAKP